MSHDMETMTCPSCRTTLRVTRFEGPTGTAQPLPDGDPLDAVRDFAQHISGDFSAAELHRMYEDRAVEVGRPSLSPRMFGRCLKALGARAYRTRTERRWAL